MHVRNRCAPLLGMLAAAVICCPRPVGAAPAVGLSWNSCSPIETAHPVVSTDRLANLVVFVQGLPNAVTGFELQIRIKSSPSYACACSGADATTVTPAWQFEPGGCQGPGRVAAQFAPAVAGCASPIGQTSFESFTTSRDSSFCVPSSCGSSNGILALRASRPQSWQLDPQVRTGLWSIQFDLSGSCALATGPGLCCEDDRPMNLSVSGVAYAIDGSPIDLGISSVSYSAGAVPAPYVSWGRLKVQYR